MQILAIDPGQAKCGVAVLSRKSVHYQAVLERKGYLEILRQLVKQYQIRQIVLGDGTGAKEFLSELETSFPNVSITLVDETYTTEEARIRYWQARPPRGLRRLLPVSMQVPPEPYDDFVAVILGERFLADL